MTSFKIFKNKSIFVIPFRKNSKRLVGKNKKFFKGLKLYQWSINYALKSGLKIPIIVSSDDHKELDQIRNKNIVLHYRKSKLAKDRSSTFNLLRAIFDDFKHQFDIDQIILLQPTSPLREKNLVRKAFIEISNFKNWTSLIEIEKIPSFQGQVIKDQWIPLQEESTRSQDIKSKYTPTGRLFIYNVNKTLRLNDPIGKFPIPLYFKGILNSNIDTKKDFRLAEINFETHKSKYNYLIK